jgi:hypothetical protein
VLQYFFDDDCLSLDEPGTDRIGDLHENNRHAAGRKRREFITLLAQPPGITSIQELTVAWREDCGDRAGMSVRMQFPNQTT